MEKWQNSAVFRERSVIKTLTMFQLFRKVLRKVFRKDPCQKLEYAVKHRQYVSNPYDVP